MKSPFVGPHRRFDHLEDHNARIRIFECNLLTIHRSFLSYLAADLSSWWIPSAEEMRALSRQAQRVAALQIPFEPLLISQDLGSLIWNPAPEANYCSSFQRQLSLLRWELSALEKPKNDYVYEKYHAQLSGRPQDHICLYRLDDHIQLHPGPVISSAGLIGRFSVTSFRPLGLLNLASLDPIEVADSGDGLVHSVYRVTGVAIPTAFTIHFTTFEVLRSRAKQHNASIPDAPTYLLPLT
ncbi:unnamed protein product [Protopolystoma xenopodis]|uniref:Uncharacterized protein n=1 Tax=Protopolystoma xenopodis TaxID=117903 RepID=A0A3S5A246_9PLAT|nr:unnamed protein product [Protopolystoma xenopodis]